MSRKPVVSRALKNRRDKKRAIQLEIAMRKQILDARVAEGKPIPLDDAIRLVKEDKEN